MKFDEFLDKTKGHKAPEGIVLDGTFNCQTCNVQVEEAEWFMAQKILRWVCPEGHTSYIEGFSL